MRLICNVSVKILPFTIKHIFLQFLKRLWPILPRVYTVAMGWIESTAQQHVVFAKASKQKEQKTKPKPNHTHTHTHTPFRASFTVGAWRDWVSARLGDQVEALDGLRGPNSMAFPLPCPARFYTARKTNENGKETWTLWRCWDQFFQYCPFSF